METSNYYAIIPAHVRYCSDLQPNAKLFFGEITALSNHEGYCYASNEYFSNLYKVSERQIINWVNALEAQKFITVIIEKGNQRKIFISDCRTNTKEEVLPEWLDRKAWEEWSEFRAKDKKRKLTKTTIKKQIEFLEKNKEDHIAIIEQSIRQGYMGLFVLSSSKRPIKTSKVEII